MKLLSCIIIISCFNLTPLIPYAHAQKINLSVQVLPRKLTDTINDFDFSALNSPNASAGNQTVATVASHPGIVKGAAIQSPSSSPPNSFTKIMKYLDKLWSRIF